MNYHRIYSVILLSLQLTTYTADSSYLSAIVTKTTQLFKSDNKFYTVAAAALTIGSIAYIKNQLLNKPAPTDADNKTSNTDDNATASDLTNTSSIPSHQLNHLPHSVQAITVVTPAEGIIATAADKYLCIWHRQQDESWQLQQIVGNSNRKNATQHTATIKTLATLNKRTIATGSADGTVVIWQQNLLGSWAACKRLGKLNNVNPEIGHTNGITSINAISPTKIITTSHDRRALIWQQDESHTWHPTHTLGQHRNMAEETKGHIASVSTAAVIDESTIATGGADHSIIIWAATALGNWHAHQRLGIAYNDHEERGHTKEVRTIIRIKEDLIASGSLDRTIILWQKNADGSWQMRQRLGQLLNFQDPARGHTNAVTSLVAYNEKTLVSGSLDKTALVWQQDEDNLWKITKQLGCIGNTDESAGHTNGISSLALLDNHTLITSSLDKTALSWKLS